MQKMLEVMGEKIEGYFPHSVCHLAWLKSLIMSAGGSDALKRKESEWSERWPTNFLSQPRCRSRGSVLNRCRISKRQKRTFSALKYWNVFLLSAVKPVRWIVSSSNLQQCYPNEDASHHRQVVLKPFLKLRDAAFDVDEVPLLRVLVNNRNKTMQVEKRLFRQGL